MIKLTLAFLAGIVLAILAYNVYLEKIIEERNIQLRSGQTLNVELPTTTASIEIRANEDDVTTGFTLNDRALTGNRINYESSLIESYFWTEFDEKRFSTTDETSDGQPDYRLIKDSNTGKVKKETPIITWSEQ